MRAVSLPIALLGGALVVSAPVAGGVVLDSIEREVPHLYRLIATRTAVPYKVLYAVSLAESGHPAPTNGEFRPWPWSLNVGGEPARFASKDEALAALVRAIDAGRRNIDIGLGQVNYRWNGHLFPTLDGALDPSANLAAATRVLRRELDACTPRLWTCAIRRYHSPGARPDQVRRADAYLRRVLWYLEQL